MRYRVEHEFTASARDVIRAMFTPDVVDRLLPRISRIQEAEPLERIEEGALVKRKVRYMPVPAIKAVGPKKVKPRWMEWIEHSQADLDSLEVRYRNVPTTARVAKLLENSGTMHFIEESGSCTRRIIEGELRVKVFLLGKLAERLIFAYAKEILDEEAQALQALLREGGA